MRFSPSAPGSKKCVPAGWQKGDLCKDTDISQQPLYACVQSVEGLPPIGKAL